MEPINPAIALRRLIKTLRTKGISDERVLDAFGKVPRHCFVDGGMYAQAYDDNALPIGFGQTISQPYIVALMTELLQLEKDDKILEIGTGSGFQTALLAQFSRRVYTIERNRELGEVSRERLREMGYVNVAFKIGDGSLGWPQHSQFNKIIVTAAAPVLPQTLLDQLAEGGRMVIPVGDQHSQDLMVYEKTGQGVEQCCAAHVVFVPLIGQKGWRE
ncbi:MAG: protein-L-isoaspartate(D-aspartate) O-methyltransferase [Chitinispirillaceae bacterium]|nr:protein-L-isoaspartate(D-aspartate) O-methyltransferase [Chitinispirillaceae bacterium]